MQPDLHLFPDDASPPTMPVAIDKEPAITMSQSPTHKYGTKHIDFTMALARDYYVQHGRAIMEQCPTAERIADMLTEQPGPGSFVVFRSSFMGLVPFLRF